MNIINWKKKVKKMRLVFELYNIYKPNKHSKDKIMRNLGIQDAALE